MTSFADSVHRKKLSVAKTFQDFLATDWPKSSASEIKDRQLLKTEQKMPNSLKQYDGNIKS